MSKNHLSPEQIYTVIRNQILPIAYQDTYIVGTAFNPDEKDRKNANVDHAFEGKRDYYLVEHTHLDTYMEESHNNVLFDSLATRLDSDMKNLTANNRFSYQLSVPLKFAYQLKKLIDYENLKAWILRNAQELACQPSNQDFLSNSSEFSIGNNKYDLTLTRVLVGSSDFPVDQVFLSRHIDKAEFMKELQLSTNNRILKKHQRQFESTRSRIESSKDFRNILILDVDNYHLVNPNTILTAIKASIKNGDLIVQDLPDIFIVINYSLSSPLSPFCRLVFTPKLRLDWYMCDESKCELLTTMS